MHDSGRSLPVRIAYVGGGSLNWAMALMSDLAFDRRLKAHVCLYDIDHDAAKRNAEIGARYADVSHGVPATYEACEALQEALTGADIVVISILPGAFADMAQDIEIPARYGVPQAVGDTVGPGGFLRALRAIPMMAQIANAIKDHAPDAFVCNLTNPMSVLTDTIYQVFPTVKAWGECHEVTKIRTQVAWIANQAAGYDVFDHRDVLVNVLGINHFTFVDAIFLDDHDMLPAYKRFVADHAATGWAQSETRDPEKARYFGSCNLVAFDMLGRFGVAGAAGDRHLAEFLPVADYLADPEDWGFALTPVDYRIRDREARIKRAEDMRSGKAPVEAKRSDEALTDQIAAVMGGGSFVSNVNLPNRGQLEGLPQGAIVETNAVFDNQGVRPLPAGRLPEALEAIVVDHASRQTALVAAVLAEDRAALFPLFRSDPLVRHLGGEDARRMYDEMVMATAKLIPEALRGAG
ncbi:MAG: alpha-galactosidase [Paracoccaceae bacterium]